MSYKTIKVSKSDDLIGRMNAHWAERHSAREEHIRVIEHTHEDDLFEAGLFSTQYSDVQDYLDDRDRRVRNARPVTQFVVDEPDREARNEFNKIACIGWATDSAERCADELRAVGYVIDNEVLTAYLAETRKSQAYWEKEAQEWL